MVDQVMVSTAPKVLRNHVQTSGQMLASCPDLADPDGDLVDLDGDLADLAAQTHTK